MSQFYGHSPNTATAEDLQLFQLHLISTGVSNIAVNATITGLRVFFDITLNRKEVTAKLATVHEPRKLPVVLSSAIEKQFAQK